MKTFKKLALAGIFCFAGTAYAQQTKLTGDINGLGDVDLKIYYYAGAEQKTGDIKTKDGKFSWIADFPDAQKVTIMFPKRAAWLYLEPGNISIKGTADSLHLLKVTGSKTQAEADAFSASQKFLSDQESPLYQKYGKVSKEEQRLLEEKIAELRIQKRALADKYISGHPESAFSLSLVTDRAGMGSYKDVQSIYDKLGPKAKASAEGKRIAERLVILKRSSIGESMLSFTQNDTEGKAGFI